MLLAVYANADIALISAGTSIDEGYFYPKPNVPFELPPPKEVNIQKLIDIFLLL